MVSQHDFILFRESENKIEGIAIREKLAKEFFLEGDYLKSAEMWESAAKIAEIYPQTKDSASEYYLNAYKAKQGPTNKEIKLKSNLFAMFATFALLVGILFLSPNFTGSAILDPTVGVTNWIGVALIIVGILALYVWFIFKQ